MRRTNRNTQLFSFPFFRITQEVSQTCVNCPDTDREFPAVSIPVQATGKEYLHHVAVILTQTPDTLITHTPGDEKGGPSRFRGIEGVAVVGVGSY